MNIYNDIPELLSLGAQPGATLDDLTSTYAPFVNGEKIIPKLILEFKMSEEKQFFKKDRECVGCDKFIGNEILRISKN